MCVSVFSGLGTFWRGSQGDLIGALLFPLTGSLITATSLAIACRRVDPTRATLTLPSRAVLHDLWRFASFQLLSRICGAVGQEIGKLVLASRYGTGQVTWFSVPFTLIPRVQRLLGTASGILCPRIARLSKSGDSAQVSETYRRAQKALIPVAIAMTVPLGAASKPFLSAWISPEFADHAWQPMTVLAVAFAISGAGVGFVQTLWG